MGRKKLSKERITDLDKLYLVELRYGGLILSSSQLLLQPQLSKNDTHFKSGQRGFKNNHLTNLVETRDTPRSISIVSGMSDRSYRNISSMFSHFRFR